MIQYNVLGMLQWDAPVWSYLIFEFCGLLIQLDFEFFAAWERELWFITSSSPAFIISHDNDTSFPILILKGLYRFYFFEAPNDCKLLYRPFLRL